MIRFSINGGSPESYQKIHRVPGRIFPKLLDSIRRIHQSRVAHHRQEKLLMGVTFLVCPDNYTEIASFCRQIRDCGVDTIWLRACDNMAGLSKAQLEHVDQQLREANSLTQPGFTVFSKQFEVLRRHFSLHYRHENIPCWSAMTKAFIQPNSEVRVCLSRSDFVLGRVDQQHFFDIWSGPTHCDFVTQQKWNCFGPCAERRFNNSLNFIDQSAFTDLYRGIA